MLDFHCVGETGFEPATPCSQSRCANRTALHPVCSLLPLLPPSLQVGGAVCVPKQPPAVCCIMPLPTAADCWSVVADRRPSPLAPRCRPPWRAGHLSEVRGAKITAFSVPTNFSLRNLSPARRVITAEGTAARRPAARKPAESPHSRCRGGITPGGASPPKEPPALRYCVRRSIALLQQTVETASPSKLPAIASARRGGTLSQRPVASARYRSRPSNRWLKSSCGAGL